MSARYYAKQRERERLERRRRQLREEEAALCLPRHLLELLADVVGQLADYRAAGWSDSDRRHALMQELDRTLQAQLPEGLDLKPRMRLPATRARKE